MLHTKVPAAGVRRRASLAAALAAALLTGACAQSGLETGSVSLADAAPASAEPVTSAPLPPAATEPEVALKPETAALIKEARKLRTEGDKTKALALLDKADGADSDKAIVKERGLLALELGHVERAETLLKKAHDEKAPDWRVHSALGATLSAKGQQKAAQEHFHKALALAPDHPSVLNNLALSLALDGKQDEAEKLLRRIAETKGAEPKAQQNLALILGLKGDMDGARKVSEAALPADVAKANMSTLSRMAGERTRVSRAEPTPAGEPVKAASAATQADAPIMQLAAPN